MKKIYIKGNYIIADNDGLFSEYPTSRCAYTKTPTSIFIKEQIDTGTLVIPLTEIGLWYDEAGVVAFTESTLTEFLQNNTANFSSASGGSGALITENVILGVVDFESNLNGGGVQLLPTPTVGTWHDVKEIIYKWKGGTTPYFGLDSNNLFQIFGGGQDVRYQIYTTRDVFIQTDNAIWKQYPQTREAYNFLAFNPIQVFTPFLGVAPLTAFFNRENLIGGDGTLELEIIYEVKTI